MHAIARKQLTLYSLAVCFSLLLSVWAMLKTVVINPDAICYLYSAEAVAKGLAFASHLCEQARWPFYSVLIFGLSKISHLSSIASAYMLDGFFSLISVVTFIAIISLFTQRMRVIALSAVVILLAHEFNGLRVEIIRDHGFWAFYLLSLFFALCYFMRSSQHSTPWRYALLWSASLVIATLFRIEGVVFLLLLPLAALIDRRHTMITRIKMFFQLNTLMLLGGVALLVWIMLHPLQQLGRLAEIQFQLQHGMSEFIHSFVHTANALSTYVLNGFSSRDAYWIALGMFAVWYVFIVIANVSPIYAILIIYAFSKKLAGLTRETRLVLWAYILINIIITAIFLVDNMFLAKRYLIALSLVLMLWVPFALDNLVLQWHKRKWPLLLAGILILIYGLGGIFDFGHSKKYIRDGGDWLALHASANQKIYSNDYQLLYYSNHIGDAIFSVGKEFENVTKISNGKWKQYDYIALRVSQDDLEKKSGILSEINLTPVAIFENDRHDQVRIYKIGKWRMQQ